MKARGPSEKRRVSKLDRAKIKLSEQELHASLTDGQKKSILLPFDVRISPRTLVVDPR